MPPAAPVAGAFKNILYIPTAKIAAMLLNAIMCCWLTRMIAACAFVACRREGRHA